MKQKVIRFIGYALASGAAAGLLLIVFLAASAAYSRSRFIKETVAILSPVKSPEEIARLDQSYRPDMIYTRRFGGGEWAAARALDEEDTEYGFAAAIVYTSRGEFWITRSHQFCGFEGLTGELGSVQAGTLGDFITGISLSYGFERYK